MPICSYYIRCVYIVCRKYVSLPVKTLENCDYSLISGSIFINPFNASCSKLLLFEGFSAILV